jgi:hypothetical protein
MILCEIVVIKYADRAQHAVVVGSTNSGGRRICQK